MNEDYWTANDVGWDCSRKQSMWANSHWAGLSNPDKIPSNGRPNHKSNGGLGASDMGSYSGSGTDANGNPLSPENYRTIHKWGVATKWSNGNITAEKGWRYEGE